MTVLEHTSSIAMDYIHGMEMAYVIAMRTFLDLVFRVRYKYRLVSCSIWGSEIVGGLVSKFW